MLTRQVEETIISHIDGYRKVGHLIDTRPTPYSRLILILYLMGYRQYEIIEVLGISKQALSATLFRARQDARQL